MTENSLYDAKSIKEITGKTTDWNEVAKDCVAFSNAQGGVIEYGIEDGENMPPQNQIIPNGLPVQLENKIKGKTANVSAYTEIKRYQNGSETILLHITRSLSSSSTCNGKFFMRIGDNSESVIGSDINRLAAEKGCFSWEDTTTKWSWKDADQVKLTKLIENLRSSERVNEFVKQKEPKELLNHLFLTEEESEYMTNLGVLFIGTQSQRGR